mmetsp:Transcript_27067/g.43335  ORF Transcript_27067/g.43335 Transcript_27067/m.43335 type:complete len:244 (+) Transcript_27067:367-1098(+)
MMHSRKRHRTIETLVGELLMDWAWVRDTWREVDTMACVQNTRSAGEKALQMTCTHLHSGPIRYQYFAKLAQNVTNKIGSAERCCVLALNLYLKAVGKSRLKTPSRQMASSHRDIDWALGFSRWINPMESICPCSYHRLRILLWATQLPKTKSNFHYPMELKRFCCEWSILICDPCTIDYSLNLKLQLFGQLYMKAEKLEGPPQESTHAPENHHNARRQCQATRSLSPNPFPKHYLSEPQHSIL